MSKKTTRVSIDLPTEIHARLKEMIKKTSQYKSFNQFFCVYASGLVSGEIAKEQTIKNDDCRKKGFIITGDYTG